MTRIYKLLTRPEWLAAIRGAYRTLAALGYEIAVGRLAAAKLAEQAMPVRADG